MVLGIPTTSPSSPIHVSSLACAETETSLRRMKNYFKPTWVITPGAALGPDAVSQLEQFNRDPGIFFGTN